MPVSLKPKLTSTAFAKASAVKASLSITFLIAPLFFFGQSLTGLWIGTTSNDSTTVRKDQSFEIALTEYKGKVYGYSRSEFIVNDTLYYIVKRVKGTIEGDRCEVTDDEIISYNFRGKLDKKVHVTSTFIRNKVDSTWSLDGTWKTNVTKKYYGITGKVKLSEEKDLNASKIFPHLEELKLADNIAFYQERKETPSIVRVVKPEQDLNTIETPADLQSSGTTAIVSAPQEKKRAETDPAISANILREEKIKEEAEKERIRQQEIADAKKNEKPVPVVSKETEKPAITKSTNDSSGQPAPTTIQTENPVTTNNVQPDNSPRTVALTDADRKRIQQQTQVQANQQKPSIVNKTPEQKTNQTTLSNLPAGNNTTAKTNGQPNQQQEVAKQIKGTNDHQSTATKEVRNASTSVGVKPDITAKAAIVEGRKSEFTQEVSFKSDSLQISIYDNGVVDGDTVSVYMNGEVILAKQGLKSSAIKKTIYLTPGNDEFTLVLFADNLGQYPPNTGLLVVRDGNDVYNLRFSADFQKNAGVIFRRKASSH